MTQTFIRSSSQPGEKIKNSIAEATTRKKFTMPLDRPPIYMNIAETKWQYSVLSNKPVTLTPIADYELPIPAPLVDSNPIRYNPNFSSREQGSRIFPRVAKILDSPGAKLAASVGGLVVNQFKSVALEQPEFKEHTFEWKLSPRSRDESDMLTKMIHSLRKGMLPSVDGGRGVLHYPNIFWIAFKPSPVYMYKFKPAVIQNLDVDYAGNNPAPSFFFDDNTHEKPESIRLRINFLEIGYWVSGDLGTGEYPSNDPHDTDPFYRLKTGGEN